MAICCSADDVAVAMSVAFNVIDDAGGRRVQHDCVRGGGSDDVGRWFHRGG